MEKIDLSKVVDDAYKTMDGKGLLVLLKPF